MSTENMPFQHSSILVKEIIDSLDDRPDGIVIDATLGLGGHTEAILEHFPDASVIGIDQDERAIGLAVKKLKRFGERFKYIHSNFSDIGHIFGSQKIGDAAAVIADLGVSSMQLDDPERGFSFRADAPLDMRMNADTHITAADLIETMTQDDLANVIYKFGEERASRRIARAIKYKQEQGEPVKTTRQLAELIERSIGRGKKDKIHPATKTFQALRIAVNKELDVIEPFIIDSIDILRANGILAIITFHSLEDRIVKQVFRRSSGKCECPVRQPVCTCGAKKLVEIVNKKPIVPTEEEMAENPRARSAKLRICKKI